MTIARGRRKTTKDGRTKDHTWSGGANRTATTEPISISLLDALEEFTIDLAATVYPTVPRY